MIKYRLKFTFKKEDDNINRENNLNSLLSEVDLIESDTPIRRLIDGEVVLLSNVEYRVLNTKIAFENDADITYYDFIVLLENIEEANRREKEECERRMKEEIAKKLEEERYKYKSKKKSDYESYIKDWIGNKSINDLYPRKIDPDKYGYDNYNDFLK